MKESHRNLLFGLFLFSLISILGLFTYFRFLQPGFFIPIQSNLLHIVITAVFLILMGLFVNELLHWKKQGKRSDAFDLVLLGFIFISIYLATFDPMNSIIGAFGIFIIFGAYELREYEVLNKLLIITAVTYNVIFFAGLTNSILHDFGLLLLEGGEKNWIIRDTAFSFAIWIILILGFILFGRKYIVVLRFMSPEYLTMFLYIFSWLAVRGIALIWQGSLTQDQQRNLIYLALFLTNWFVYAISGPVLDVMLGIKPVTKQIKNIDIKLENETDSQTIKKLRDERKLYLELHNLVNEVCAKLKMKKPVKVGFGKYPILNAMAYGAFFDKRIAIISNDINEIPHDELKGVIGHELHHAKSLDTLILSIISSVQLAIFWLLKWPATYYDYVFGGDQPFEIWVFILINLGITLVIYVFIRILEGRADQNTKRTGYGNELAKGLYNLEGFYSSGREIGLDTMLLAEEKLITYNRVENYSSTAQYLDRNMFNPKPLILMSNLMNSHPPSYLRILAMYDEKNQISPVKESILPFLLMGKGYRTQFASHFQRAREMYRAMANTKFKSMFGIENYAVYLQSQKKKEIFENLIGEIYLHVDALNYTIGIGKLNDIQINDEVCSPYSYQFTAIDVKVPDNERFSEEVPQIIEYNRTHLMDKTYTIFPESLKLIEIEFGAVYQLSRRVKAILVAVKIDPQLPMKLAKLNSEAIPVKKRYKLFKKYLRQHLTYYFLDENYAGKGEKKLEKKENTKPNLIVKNWRYKLKFNLNAILEAKGKDIFLLERGTLQLLHLKDIESGEKKYDYRLRCVHIGSQEELFYSLNEILVKKDEFGLQFHTENENFNDEIKILTYLKYNHTRTTIYLKKAINNVETGYINSIFVDEVNPKENSFLVVKNVYGNEIKILLKKIETMVFSFRTIGIINKSKMSIAERFMQKILYWTNPQEIFYP